MAEEKVKCSECGKEYGIGEWPLCPHGQLNERPPFIPFWDEHISEKPVYVESLAQWNRLMRQNHCDVRPAPSKGDLSARMDRVNQIRKEREHAA